METEIINPPLSAEEYKFVDAYCACRDVSKAAVEAGFPSKAGSGLYRRKAVHDEITRRMENITSEVNLQIVKKRLINVEMLDANLKQVITIPRKTLMETPSLATPKVNAIEMGYKRIGLLLDDNFVPDASSGPSKDETPRIYRPAEQTIITHQITETRQVVTNRAPQSTVQERIRQGFQPPTGYAPTPTPEPTAFEPDEDPWKDF